MSKLQQETIEQAIKDANDFIKLAEQFEIEHAKFIKNDQQYYTYKMKSRAKMKRASLKLSESLVSVRKIAAY